MKAFKYSLGAVALFLVIAVGFFCYSVTKLPDPIAVKNKFMEQSPKAQVRQEIGKEVDDLAKSVEEPAVDAQASNNENSDTGAVQENKDTTTILEMVKEDYRDIRVCENLGKASQFKGMNEDTMARAMDGTAREDALIETLRFPLKHIFQSKPVKELFAEIESLEKLSPQGAEDRTSYLNKIGFYATAAQKVQEMYSMKSEYEEVGDRSYDLFVISQITAKKPELANDKHVQEFCNDLQNSIGNKDKTDIGEEKREILKLIDYAGMTPKELNFNPDKRTEFKVDLSRKGLAFGFTSPFDTNQNAGDQSTDTIAQ